jgi:cutinase
MGPAVCSGLKGKLGAGNVACQGVGGAYSAGIAENVSAKGTSQGAIDEAKKMFELAASKCPQTVILAGGYRYVRSILRPPYNTDSSTSQGTAVMMNAISTLPEGTKNRIAGVVLFGYTKNGQTKGTIPNYPTERLKVFCTKGDGVCWGQLNVSGGHFAYMGNGDGTAATSFLVSKANGFVPGAATEPGAPPVELGAPFGAKGGGGATKGKGGAPPKAAPPPAASDK